MTKRVRARGQIWFHLLSPEGAAKHSWGAAEHSWGAAVHSWEGGGRQDAGVETQRLARIGCGVVRGVAKSSSNGARALGLMQRAAGCDVLLTQACK